MTNRLRSIHQGLMDAIQSGNDNRAYWLAIILLRMTRVEADDERRLCGV